MCSSHNNTLKTVLEALDLRNPDHAIRWELIGTILCDLTLHRQNKREKLFVSSSKIEKQIVQTKTILKNMSVPEVIELACSFHPLAQDRIKEIALNGAIYSEVPIGLIHVGVRDQAFAPIDSDYASLAEDEARLPTVGWLFWVCIRCVKKIWLKFADKTLTKVASLLRGDIVLKISRYRDWFATSISAYDPQLRILGVLRHQRVFNKHLPIFIQRESWGRYICVSGNHRLLVASICGRHAVRVLVIGESAQASPIQHEIADCVRSSISKPAIRFQSIDLQISRIFRKGAIALDCFSELLNASRGEYRSTKIRVVRFRFQSALVEISDPEEHIQKFWLARRFYEADPLGILSYSHLHHQGKVFLDVGANIGNHTLFFLSVCRARHVYALEPFPRSFMRLERNVSLNGFQKSCSLHRIAASDSPAMAGFIQPLEHNDGSIRLVEGQDAQVVRLDDLLEVESNSDSIPRFPVGVLKIDCEGYTEKIILGASLLIRKDRPDIFAECEELSERIRIDLLLRSMGYIRMFDQAFNATPTYLWKWVP